MIKKTFEIALKEFALYKDITKNRIKTYYKDTGIDWFSDNITTWHIVFVNWVAMRANYTRSQKANISSWLNVGISTEKPSPRDIVVFWEDLKSPIKQIGFYLGHTIDGNHLYCIGGNKKDKIQIECYSLESVIAFRAIEEITKNLSFRPFLIEN